MWRNGANDFEPCFLHRYTFDPATGSVSEERLDDIDHAFPRHDERRVGFDYSVGFGVAPRNPGDEEMGTDTSIVRWEMPSGVRSVHDFGPGRLTGEPVFVPRDDTAAEGDGFIVTFVYDKATNSSEFVVLDARDMAAAPLATVPIPQRIPHGFHGSWVPAA
jgi:carotenoid cleavage dioxygenase-like enzyme